MNFLVPRPGKVTASLRSSSSPSTATTVPTPYSGWRTFWPSMGSEPADFFPKAKAEADLPKLGVLDGVEVLRDGVRLGGGVPRTRRANSSGEYEYSGSGS